MSMASFNDGLYLPFSRFPMVSLLTFTRPARSLWLILYRARYSLIRVSSAISFSSRFRFQHFLFLSSEPQHTDGKNKDHQRQVKYKKECHQHHLIKRKDSHCYRLFFDDCLHIRSISITESHSSDKQPEHP